MKSRILLILLLAAGCVSVAGQTAPAQAPVPEDAGARKARALLDRMIQAMGGQAFLSYRDMTQEGRTASFYKGVPTGASTQYWLFWKWPDKERVELTKKRDVIYINDGDKGYEITYKGTRTQDEEQHRRYERSREYALPVVLREWLKQPGTMLFYDGVDVADQKQVEKITITNPNGRSVTLAIDSFDHLLVRKSYQWREPDTRFFDTEDEVYGNYHAVQGIQTPRNTVNLHNGDVVRQRFIASTAYNTGVADSLFQASVTYDPRKKK